MERRLRSLDACQGDGHRSCFDAPKFGKRDRRVSPRASKLPCTCHSRPTRTHPIPRRTAGHSYTFCSTVQPCSRHNDTTKHQKLEHATLRYSYRTRHDHDLDWTTLTPKSTVHLHACLAETAHSPCIFRGRCSRIFTHIWSATRIRFHHQS